MNSRGLSSSGVAGAEASPCRLSARSLGVCWAERGVGTAHTATHTNIATPPTASRQSLPTDQGTLIRRVGETKWWGLGSACYAAVVACLNGQFEGVSADTSSVDVLARQAPLPERVAAVLALDVLLFEFSGFRKHPQTVGRTLVWSAGPCKRGYDLMTLTPATIG